MGDIAGHAQELPVLRDVGRSAGDERPDGTIVVLLDGATEGGGLREGQAARFIGHFEQGEGDAGTIGRRRDIRRIGERRMTTAATRNFVKLDFAYEFEGPSDGFISGVIGTDQSRQLAGDWTRTISGYLIAPPPRRPRGDWLCWWHPTTTNSR